MELRPSAGTGGVTGLRVGSRSFLRRPAVIVAAAAAGVAAAFVPVNARGAGAAGPPADGIVCNNGVVSSGHVSFVLTARDGNILTPDGNSIYMWSYASGTDHFQYPGPVLCVHENDHVTVTLDNTLPQPVSIVFPGITGVAADGKPSQPDLAANTLTKAAATSGSVTYTFVASHPGTYLYESGTNPQIQVQMGLVGALVVRPSVGDNHIYDEETTPAGGTPIANTQFNAQTEYIHLLSEIDPDLHLAIENGASTFDMTKYKARYWMINGRSFPDTIAPNFAQHLPNQPYGALVHVQPRSASNPDPAVIRYLNAGPVAYPFHPHSNNERIVGIDGRRQLDPTAGAGGTPADTSVDRYGIVVPPGSTMEGEFTWSADPTTAQGWDPNNRPIDVPVPQDQSRTDGAYWNGTPYLGQTGPLVNGLTQYNECGEFYHVAHSHALFQATNYGASMGGMLTMVRIDPPNRSDCTKAGY